MFASLSPESERGGQGGSGEEIGDSTLLDVRTNKDYPEVVRVESSSRVPLVSASLPGQAS
jgi:hypothetical protein